MTDNEIHVRRLTAATKFNIYLEKRLVIKSSCVFFSANISHLSDKISSLNAIASRNTTQLLILRSRNFLCSALRSAQMFSLNLINYFGEQIPYKRDDNGRLSLQYITFCHNSAKNICTVKLI